MAPASPSRTTTRQSAAAIGWLLLLLTVGCTDAVPRGPEDAGDAVATAEAAPAGTTAPASAADTAARVSVHGVDLTGLGYDRGSPGAPITVVEFSDFGCGFCAKMALETKPALMAEFVDSGKVYWKYVPFVIGMFPNGDEAARAGECAAEQGRFWAMKDSLYRTQRAWKGTSDPAGHLTQLARSAGVDERRWARCYAGEGGRARTVRGNEAAARLGVRATPTFFINGRMVEGALPLNVFRGGLRQMLGGR